MRCHGQGTVYLANLAQHIHVVEVDHDGLTVDSAYVLALDSRLHPEVIAVDSQYGISGSGKYQLDITGQGKVALMTSGQPLMMQVTPDKYVNADADAVVAWSSGLRVQMQAQTHSSGVWRRRGNTGEGWELSFLGQGFALVQPSEVMPPQNAEIGQGLAAQFGTGQHGAHGQNQGNVWSGDRPANARRKGRLRGGRPFPAGPCCRGLSPRSAARVRSTSRATERVGHPCHLVVAEPAQVQRLVADLLDRPGRGQRRVLDIEMPVAGRRNGMTVQPHRADGQQRQPLDAGLLRGLPQRRALQRRVTGLAVAAHLEPHAAASCAGSAARGPAPDR